MAPELVLQLRELCNRSVIANPYIDNRRLFAKNGFNVALVARGNEGVNKLAGEINSSGGGEVRIQIISLAYVVILKGMSRLHHFPLLRTRTKTSLRPGPPSRLGIPNMNLRSVQRFTTSESLFSRISLTSLRRKLRQRYRQAWQVLFLFPQQLLWRLKQIILTGA